MVCVECGSVCGAIVCVECYSVWSAIVCGVFCGPPRLEAAGMTGRQVVKYISLH